MKTEALQLFIETVRCGSINKAAQKLLMPQQKASKMLKSLENELGVNLFLRSSKGTSLTNSGRDVYDFAIWALEAYQNMQKEMQIFEENAVPKIHIKIGAMETAIQNVLPQVMVDVYKNQKFELEVVKEMQNEIIKGVLNRELNLGILLQYQSNTLIYPKVNEQLDFFELYSSQPYFWINNSNELAKKRTLSFSDLQNCCLLTMNNADHELMDFVLQTHFSPEQSIYWADNVYYLEKFLEAYLVIALDLKNNKHLNLESNLSKTAKAIPLNVKETYQVLTGVIMRKDTAKNKNLQELLKILNY